MSIKSLLWITSFAVEPVIKKIPFLGKRISKKIWGPEEVFTYESITIGNKY